MLHCHIVTFPEFHNMSTSGSLPMGCACMLHCDACRPSLLHTSLEISLSASPSLSLPLPKSLSEFGLWTLDCQHATDVLITCRKFSASCPFQGAGSKPSTYQATLLHFIVPCLPEGAQPTPPPPPTPHPLLNPSTPLGLSQATRHFAASLSPPYFCCPFC
jgi:hypothetical protein